MYELERRLKKREKVQLGVPNPGLHFLTRIFEQTDKWSKEAQLDFITDTVGSQINDLIKDQVDGAFEVRRIIERDIFNADRKTLEVKEETLKMWPTGFKINEDDTIHNEEDDTMNNEATASSKKKVAKKSSKKKAVAKTSTKKTSTKKPSVKKAPVKKAAKKAATKKTSGKKSEPKKSSGGKGRWDDRGKGKGAIAAIGHYDWDLVGDGKLAKGDKERKVREGSPTGDVIEIVGSNQLKASTVVERLMEKLSIDETKARRIVYRAVNQGQLKIV